MTKSLESIRRRHIPCGAVFLFACVALGCGDTNARVVGEVPTNPDALYAWLEAGRYDDWDAEPERHPTAGPHGDEVRTFFDVTLAASLESENVVHQVEAAAVKELYNDDALTGWAVMVKTKPASDAGSWYFYEILDRSKPNAPIEGQGKSLCAGCHSAGTDFVLSDWP